MTFWSFWVIFWLKKSALVVNFTDEVEKEQIWHTVCSCWPDFAKPFHPQTKILLPLWLLQVPSPPLKEATLQSSWARKRPILGADTLGGVKYSPSAPLVRKKVATLREGIPKFAKIVWPKYHKKAGRGASQIIGTAGTFGGGAPANSLPCLFFSNVFMFLPDPSFHVLCVHACEHMKGGAPNFFRATTKGSAPTKCVNLFW